MTLAHKTARGPRPEHSPGERRPYLVTNPIGDADFRRFATEAVTAGVPLDAFEAALRRRYPEAAVHPRVIAGESLIVWYVYRDGHWVPPVPESSAH